MLAQVLLPAEAGPAFSAVYLRHDGDGLAKREALDGAAHLADGSGHFMAKHDRWLAEGVLPMESMKV